MLGRLFMVRSRFTIIAFLSTSTLIFGVFVFGVTYAGIDSLVIAETKPSQKELPEIHVKEPVFDFGAVWQGKVVEHDFVLQNRGKSVLNIHRVVPACGCSFAELSKSSLGSGESVNLKTYFDTNGFWGQKAKTFRVYTNDERNPAVLLTLQGEVKKEISVIPPRVFFGQVTKGDTQSRQVALYLENEKYVSLLEATSSSGFISVSKKKDKKNREIIESTLSPDVPLGILREKIVLKTNSEREPVITVPVFAKVVGELSLEPAEVSFGLLEEEAKNWPDYRVEVRNRGSNPINIISIKSDNDNVIAKYDENSAKGNPSILISLSAGARGIIKSKVSITTNHPDSEQSALTLHVYAIIERKGD